MTGSINSSRAGDEVRSPAPGVRAPAPGVRAPAPGVRSSAPAAIRVLVLSADVGESHAQMAWALARDLERREEVTSVSVLNDFSSLGPVLERLLPRGFRFHLGEVKWTYDLAYRLFTKFAPARLAGERALYALGARALQATISGCRADVVVSSYPVMNPVLSLLRRHRRIDCPVAAVVGPLGGLGFWIQPHIDLHLAQYAEALPAIARIGRGAPAAAIRPLVREEFFHPRGRGEARRALGLDERPPVVLVSGGGWGVGDLEGALECCLELADVHVLVLAGRNHWLRGALQARYRGQPRVTVLGFTGAMHDLLSAADAFVTAPAGLSCLEARMCGCPAIAYGFAFGHVRDNRRALAQRGLIRSAGTPAELSSALRAALAGGRTPIPGWANLPSAADLVLELAGVSAGTARSSGGSSPRVRRDSG